MAASLTVVILTLNEEKHLGRAIASVATIASRVVVVDSGSTDATVAIALAQGAQVLHHDWVNHADQLNWALGELPPDTGWVLRLDADEVVTPTLVAEIEAKLGDLPESVAGIRVGRRMNFLGQPVRRGGLFPVRVLRLLRHGRGRCEARWMDEHLLVDGAVADFAGEIIDDNLNPLGWWTAKHNGYAAREAIDLLNLEHRFLPYESTAGLVGAGEAGFKRWIKERVYARLPGGLRALAYFFYRFVFRLGFLDGPEGRSFHVLQGFWYRYLVDARLREVRQHMRREGVDAVQAIRTVLAIDVRPGT